MNRLITGFFLMVGLAAFGQSEICPDDSLKAILEANNQEWSAIDLDMERGKCLANSGEFEQSLEVFEGIRATTNPQEDAKNHALSLFYLGQVQYNTGNGVEAMDQFNKALSISNGLPVDKRLRTYNVMGIICMSHDEYDRSVEYFDEALACSQEAGELSGETYEYLYNNKGIAFERWGNYDSSFYNHRRCLGIRLEKGNHFQIGQSYYNLGSLFYETAVYDSSLIYFRRSLEYRKRDENPPESSLIESKIGIARALIKQRGYGEAETLLTGVKNSLLANPNPGLWLRMEKEFMELYAGMGKYKNAYEKSISYYQLKDSLYGIEKREELIRINLSNKYAEKKLQDSLVAAEQIKLAKIEEAKEKELREQKERASQIIQWSLIIALVLMLGIFILVYRNYQSKKKSSEEILLQKQEVEKQRDIAQSEKRVADEQREIAQYQKMELELINQEITDSITYAKRIQNAILPSDTAVEKALKEQFILYLPKAIVAGDFYWVREVEDKVYFAAADCTGHGVPGALVSVICSNALNRSIEEFGLRLPGKILDKTTDLLIEAFVRSNQEVKDGMDISLCCWNKSTGQFSFAGANNPLYVIKPKSGEAEVLEGALQTETHFLVEIKGDKQSVGWHDKRKPFETKTPEISKGDMVYSFTDGFPDQFGGERGKKYKYRQFKNFLLKISNLPILEQKSQLETEFNQWKGDLEQVDDVCVLGYRAV